MTPGWKEKIRPFIVPILTLVSIILAIGIGMAIRTATDWTPRKVMYLGFPGEIFINILKCLVIPIIVTSLVTALGTMDSEIAGVIGIRTVAFYLSTVFLSVVIGITVVMTIRPGDRVDISSTVHDTNDSHSFGQLTTADSVLDLFRKIFPDNLAEACTHSYLTVLIPPQDNETDEADIYTWKISHKMVEGTNILGLVTMSVVIGVTLAKLDECGRPLLVLFITFHTIVFLIAKIVVRLTPLGLFFLVISKIVEIESLSAMAAQVGLYTVTVLAGLFIHALIVLPLLYFAITRKNPYKFYWLMSEALLTAFATASSAATLPITFHCLENKVGIDPRITRFCLPIGCSLNLDGTALYEAVAALYIAQVRHVPLNIGNVILVSITATAASIGAAGIPAAGFVTLVIVMHALGLPSEDIGLILIVDWLLDRFRTVVNVIGDSSGAVIIAHLSKKTLDTSDLPMEPIVDADRGSTGFQSTSEVTNHIRDLGSTYSESKLTVLVSDNSAENDSKDIT